MSIGVLLYCQTLRVLNSSFDMTYFVNGNPRTIALRQLINDDEIFFFVINSPENTKTIIDAMKKALNAAKEEYIRRWKE